MRGKFTLSIIDAEQRLSSRIWTSKNGHRYTLEKMKDRHLIKTIHFIIKASTNSLLLNRENTCCFGMGKAWLPILKNEAKNRGLQW